MQYMNLLRAEKKFQCSDWNVTGDSLWIYSTVIVHLGSYG
jgi:hypothetical protein